MQHIVYTHHEKTCQFAYIFLIDIINFGIYQGGIVNGRRRFESVGKTRDKNTYT